MPPALIASGLACGLLLAGRGSCLRRRPWPSSTARWAIPAVDWLAVCALLTAAALSQMSAASTLSRATQLFTIAAVTFPAVERFRIEYRAAHIATGALAVVLTCAGMLIVSLPGSSPPATAEADPVGSSITTSAVATLACAGLGVRAAAHAIGALVDASYPATQPASITYGLLTLVVGCSALANLVCRASAWTGTRTETGLASAFLASTAAWTMPRDQRHAHALLVIGAGILLLLSAVVFG